MALIHIKDEQVRQQVISSVSKALESGKHPVTGKFLKNKRLTERDIRKIFERESGGVRPEPRPVQDVKPAPINLSPSAFSNTKYFDKPILSPNERESFTNVWARKCLSKERQETLRILVNQTGEFESILDAAGALIEQAGLQRGYAPGTAPEPITAPAETDVPETPAPPKVTGHDAARAKLAKRRP